MLKSIVKLSAAALLAAAFVATPLPLLAQSTNKAPAEKIQATAKKSGAGPFHGKLASMDKVAKSITVGKRTFQITSETRIFKGDKPATFDEGTVGEEVSGYVKPTADGKLVATKLTFGAKPAKQSAEKKAEKKSDKKAATPAATTTSTNAIDQPAQ